MTISSARSLLNLNFIQENVRTCTSNVTSSFSFWGFLPGIPYFFLWTPLETSVPSFEIPGSALTDSTGGTATGPGGGGVPPIIVRLEKPPQVIVIRNEKSRVPFNVPSFDRRRLWQHTLQETSSTTTRFVSYEKSEKVLKQRNGYIFTVSVIMICARLFPLSTASL